MANPPVYPKFHPRPPLLPTPATPPTPPPTIVKPPSPAYPLARQPSHGSQITSASNFTGCGFSSHTPPLFDTLSRLDLFLRQSMAKRSKIVSRVSERKNQRETMPRRFPNPIKGPIFVFDPPRNLPCQLQRCFPSSLLPYFPYFGEISFSMLSQPCGKKRSESRARFVHGKLSTKGENETVRDHRSTTSSERR